MKHEEWLKYGAIALAVVGFGALMYLALSQDSGDIENRAWVVTELGGEGAPIEGTVLTARFEDGTVSGTAGCNSYFAGYTTDGNTLEIGPAGSTLMFCEQPEGTMDQEQAYLALLQSADTFEVSGDSLVLSAGSSPVLTFADGGNG
ncbi:MAG: META domain-containing protein [Acidimicrobiia bacterium]